MSAVAACSVLHPKASIPFVRTSKTVAACMQDDIISRARVIRDNAHDFTISHAPRDQTAIDLSRVDTADPMDDPENDAEPAVLQKAEQQSHDPAARPGGMDQASAAASALAMDVDPDRQLHSFEIDSTQVCNATDVLYLSSQCLHSTQVLFNPHLFAASPQFIAICILATPVSCKSLSSVDGSTGLCIITIRYPHHLIRVNLLCILSALGSRS